MKTKTRKIAQYSAMAVAAAAVLPVACKKNSTVTDDPNITYVTLDSVLTQVNVPSQTKSIDLNNDGMVDFLMYTDIDSSAKVTIYSGVYAFNSTKAAVLTKKLNGDFFLTGTASDRYFIQPKASGDVINAAQSVWYSGFLPYTQLYTKSGVTTSSQANDFNGKGDKFIGVRFKDVSNNNHYGWLRVNLSSDGKTLKVLDGAYQVTPDAEIKAGAK